MSVGWRSTFSSRAKLRMPCTIERVLPASWAMRCASSRALGDEPSPSSSSSRCAYISTTPRGLLSSWAMPAAIWPMDASFSAWISRSWFSLMLLIASSRREMR